MSNVADRVIERLRQEDHRYDAWVDLYTFILGHLPFGPDPETLKRSPIVFSADNYLRFHGEPRPRDWHDLLGAVYE